MSGLRRKHREHARARVRQAAFLALKHSGVIHYTQGARRWQGIAANLQSRRGQFPHYADCSAFGTWCIWNGIHVAYGVRDTVNGLNWKAGFTGTMLEHGKRVKRWQRRRVGDLFIYGNGYPGEHVAIYVGNGMVISHGSEAGPLLLRANYRGDLLEVRRYI